MNHLVWLTINRSWSHSSLALPLIHQAAKDVPDWIWHRVETTTEDDSAKIAAEIVQQPCDLLCATLYLFNRMKVLDILKRIHALAPQIHIAAGGPECPASDAENMLCEYPFISTVFSGEGEAVFPDFLREFPEKKMDRRAIPGSDNAVYDNWQNSEPPLNDLFFRTDKPFVQIETSRGCPMHCAYCTSSGVKVRYRELNQVEHELQGLSDKGIREIRVLDRTFNLPQSRGAALLRMFHQFPEMHFHLEIHPQFLGDELQECFRNARQGQLHIEAGIQSLDAAVQNAIGRKSETESVLKGLRFLTECSAFETHTDLLAGLPAQTLRSLCNDLVTLMQLHPAEIQLEVLKMLPGTPVRHIAAKYGMAWSPDPPYDIMRTDTMSVEDILYSKELSRMLDLFYNHTALHPVLVAAAREKQDIFLNLADSLQGHDLNSFMDLKKRFLYLDSFLGKEFVPAKEELALQWLLSGYPQDEGPGSRAQNMQYLPAEAEFVSGNEKSAFDRATKFWCLSHGKEQLCLAFNRGYRIGRPCGIWKRRFR